MKPTTPHYSASGLVAMGADLWDSSRVFDDMCFRANSGEQVRAERYLDVSNPLSSDPERMVDVVYAEYLVRCNTETASFTDELTSRFPHLAAPISRQIAIHEAIESWPTTEENPGDKAGERSSTEPEYIGLYRVITKLGKGGQGSVYRAFHPDLGRDVVIKHSHRIPGVEEIDALRAEARLLAALDHPGLARIYDLDTHEGHPFMVMDYVDGQPLNVICSAAPMAPSRAVELMTHAASTIAYAHSQGVVHRDLKPQNVLVDGHGRVRIIDFGLASAFRIYDQPEPASSAIAGTIQYMAPEQARGESDAIGPRTDVFGLGGLLYFLLTGSPLYDAPTFSMIHDQALSGSWDRTKLDVPTIPLRLRGVCEKALASDPADRYASADQFASALTCTTRRGKARPKYYLAAGVAAIALAFAAWMTFRGPVETPPPPEPPSLIPAVPLQSRLQVRVWDQGQNRYRDLIYKLPLMANARLRFEVKGPSGRHLTLFSVDSAGDVRLLHELSPQPESPLITYPADAGENSPLPAPLGTVAVILCGRNESAFSLGEFREAIGTGAWPLLPEDSLIVVERDKVFVDSRNRAVGDPTKQDDPEGQVLNRLDAVRSRLAEKCDVIAGVSFSHR